MPRRPGGAALMPVDKQHALPPRYRPHDLVTYGRADKDVRVRRVIVPDLDAVLEACDEAARESALVVSAFRSHAYQARLFAAYSAGERAKGLSPEAAEERANTYSARPGHSEHQLGTVVDISVAALSYELDQSFGSRPAGRWLREHAHRFGFVLSYPAAKQHLTGYIYEPWHLRWIGRHLAARLHAAGYLDPACPTTLGGWLQSGAWRR